MSIKPGKVQFNGGELSPWLEGRIDIAKYDKTAKLCRNFIPLAEGSLKRRGGTRFVAETLPAQDLLFKIKTLPEDAVVYINGTERREVYVAYGDTVDFEVQADGYESQSGKMVITESMEILVELIPSVDSVTLEIRTVPEDAVVKIDGIIRKTYVAQVGTKVSYMAYKDGYDAISGSVVMTEDKVLTLTLQAVEEESVEYGDWGDPVCFVACTAACNIKTPLKCFCFRFTNGYLAILFDAGKKVPDDTDTRLFFKETRDGYDTVVWKGDHYVLASLSYDKSAVRYKDLDGTILGGLSILEMKALGWQINEDGEYASFYTRYDGTVLGKVVRIYYNGELVWKLKGRNNG